MIFKVSLTPIRQLLDCNLIQKGFDIGIQVIYINIVLKDRRGTVTRSLVWGHLRFINKDNSLCKHMTISASEL